MVKLVDLKGEWAAAIGQAFIAFGAIEHVTIACLKEIPRDRIYRSTSKLNLVPRIELLLEMLEAYPGEPFSQLCVKLQQAKSLVKTRNLIAHNPLVLDFYERGDGSMLHKEIIVSLHKEQHSISLPELQKYAEEAEKLASELYGCSSMAFAALRASASA